jgi:hypothetical protein
MIRDALYYLRDDDWTRTVLIGGILSLLGFLVVPTILVLGYLVGVLRGTMDDADPPAFDEWGDLLVDGLKAVVITLAYGFVPAVVGTVAVAGGVLSVVAISTVSTGSGAGAGSGAAAGGVGLAVALLGSLLALVLGLVAAYVIPAATAAFAETGRLGDAFSVSELRPVLTSGTYATAWAVAFGTVLGAGLIGSALSAIPLIGVVFAAFVSFYAAVVASHVIGRAWGEHRTHERIGGDESSAEKPAV